MYRFPCKECFLGLECHGKEDTVSGIGSSYPKDAETNEVPTKVGKSWLYNKPSVKGHEFKRF